MRVLRQARAEWADRNPIGRSLIYQGVGVAPHFATQRASYTVPTGKKVRIMSGCLSVSRGFATTLPDVHSAYIQTSFGYLLAWVKGEEATWRDPIVAVGESGAAKSGETLSIWTENLDGDGTVYYFISVRLTEYDE